MLCLHMQCFFISVEAGFHRSQEVQVPRLTRGLLQGRGGNNYPFTIQEFAGIVAFLQFIHTPDVKEEEDKKAKDRYVPSCGRHNKNGVGIKVEGAKTTQFGEWPHMCLVFKEGGAGDAGGFVSAQNTFVCGASLIAPGMVLTAAHCVESVLPICGAFLYHLLEQFLPFFPETLA